MEPLKPRDKVTQHMTRDGLTLDNQTTGESVNVSSREAEQEYTAQPEGAAEKILERADELHDRHKARKAAKDAGKTVAQATGPVSRLQFTTEERASPAACLNTLYCRRATLSGCSCSIALNNRSNGEMYSSSSSRTSAYSNTRMTMEKFCSYSGASWCSMRMMAWSRAVSDFVQNGSDS